MDPHRLGDPTRRERIGPGLVLRCRGSLGRLSCLGA
jgi:hypothetical protein